jgi:hypothetical protein
MTDIREALAELVAEIQGGGVTDPTLRKARAALCSCPRCGEAQSTPYHSSEICSKCALAAPVPAQPAGEWVESTDEYGRRRSVFAPSQPVAQPLTDEWIERHALFAKDCPPNSAVILVSSIRRLQERSHGIGGKP